eukprot:m.137480 g.137480  ORF g.137480 m.137480 type:complete len:295 (+) comp29921_c6_seq1:505-1389(+)
MTSSGAATGLEMNTHVMTDAEILTLLRDNVRNVNEMRFRNSHECITTFIISTYRNGLRMVQGNPALVNHSKNAIQFIFSKVSEVSQHERVAHLKGICEAFMSCQAEQARVIDDIYGQISGRDKTLRDQILSLLDRFKQQTLDEVTLLFHPGSDVSTRLPHIQSRYRVDVGAQLGLAGIENAKLDQHIERSLPHGQSERYVQKFRERFPTTEFVKAVVADINQQDVDAERFILPTTLFNWAQPDNKIDNQNFDSHSIFYNDETPDLYNGKPREENEHTKPFVHPAIVVNVLKRVL